MENAVKASCERTIRDHVTNGKQVDSWEYIRPFDYEAGRLGFAVFLRDNGKMCNHINEGPQYDRIKHVYDVRCSEGHQYTMRFDYLVSKWQIVE